MCTRNHFDVQHGCDGCFWSTWAWISGKWSCWHSQSGEKSWRSYFWNQIVLEICCLYISLSYLRISYEYFTKTDLFVLYWLQTFRFISPELFWGKKLTFIGCSVAQTTQIPKHLEYKMRCIPNYFWIPCHMQMPDHSVCHCTINVTVEQGFCSP